MSSLLVSLDWVARSPWRAFIFLFVLSLCIRYYVLPHTLWTLVPSADRELGAIVKSLVNTGRYADPYVIPTGPTAHLPPLYPFLLSLIYRWTAPSHPAEALRLLFLLSASLLAALLPWFSDRFGLGSQAGFLAGLAAAVMAAEPGSTTADPVPRSTRSPPTCEVVAHPATAAGSTTGSSRYEARLASCTTVFVATRVWVSARKGWPVFGFGSKRVSFDELRRVVGTSNVRLAHEDEFARFFPDCEVGAMPPFGNLYGFDVYVDPALAEDEEIFFIAGSHTEVMRMAYADFERLVNPRVAAMTIV